MNAQEFAQQVKEIYNKYFPESLCTVNTKGCLYRNISINCFLVGERSELINGISGNDMFHISFMLDCNGRELPKGYEETLPERLTLEATHKEYTINPTESWCVYGGRSIAFRKSHGTPDKILAILDKTFARLRDSVLDDLEAGNIHKDYIEIVRRKLNQ